MNKKGAFQIIAIIIAIAVILAVGYLFLFTKGVGILVSCDEQKIVSIRNVPPPLMAMIQPEICKVNITVNSLEGILICNKYATIYSSEKGVVKCSNLGDFEGERVNIDAEFFDLEGNFIESDSKRSMLVNP